MIVHITLHDGLLSNPRRHCLRCHHVVSQNWNCPRRDMNERRAGSSEGTVQRVSNMGAM